MQTLRQVNHIHMKIFLKDLFAMTLILDMPDGPLAILRTDKLIIDKADPALCRR